MTRNVLAKMTFYRRIKRKSIKTQQKQDKYKADTE